MVINLLLIFFSNALLISSIFVVMVQNSIYSVLFLVLSFVSAAGVLFLIECEFISLLFIIIYVGAIAVLFLFVVMMLDIKMLNIKKDLIKYFPFGLFIGMVFLINIIIILFKNFKNNPYQNSFLYNYYTNWFDKIDSITEIEALGQILYTHYVLQFLIAGLILLLAVIGSVSLTINKAKQQIKTQIIFRQLSRSYKNVILHN